MEVSLSRYRKQRREINSTKVHWRLLSRAKDSTVFPQRDCLGILVNRPFSMNLESRISGILRTKLERELDEDLRKLKVARDSNFRREILRKLRHLLSDADRILDSSIQS
jgi:hypothetical protein